MKNIIDYSDVIDREFGREDVHDEMCYNKFGHHWFIVTKKLTKLIYLDWDCNTRQVSIIRVNKDQDIKGKIDNLTLDQVDEYINFFKK